MIALPDHSPVPDRVASEFLSDVWTGLRKPRKTLPCKYFYDSAGSKLFDAICDLPEYYPTRCELEVMQTHAPQIAWELRHHRRMIELGSGSSLKTRSLLQSLRRPMSYIPVDISGEHLLTAAKSLRRDFPGIEVEPICGDFTQAIEFPPSSESSIVYFPGSTIGNFNPNEAQRLLRQMSQWAGPEGCLLIGFDLEKDVEVLCRAYDDAAGVTARFNRNLLRRINRELNANFEIETYNHRVCYNDDHHRIEMHLDSGRQQEVMVAGECFEFEQGESIHTENSHKYSIDRFTELAADSGWRSRCAWTDQRDYFCVMLLDHANVETVSKRGLTLSGETKDNEIDSPPKGQTPF